MYDNILDYIKLHHQQHTHSPSDKQIAVALHINIQVVRNGLRDLMEDGRIFYSFEFFRKIEVK